MVNETKKEIKQSEKFHFWAAVWPFVKDYKKNMIIAAIGSMITGAMLALQPLVIKYIVDDGIMGKTASGELLEAAQRFRIVLFLCAFYLAISVIRVSSWGIGYHNALNCLESFLLRIRSRFFHHVEHLSSDFYETRSTGELTNYIMGSPMNNIKMYLDQMIVAVPFQAMSLAVSLTALFYYDWRLTLVLLAVALTMMVLNYFSRRKIRRITHEYLKTESTASKYITDMIHGMGAIRLHAVEDNTYHKFQDYVEDMKTKGVKLTFSKFIEGCRPELTQYLGTAIVYAVGAALCIYKGLSVGTLYAFLSSMGAIMAVLISWMNLGLLHSSASAGMEKIVSVLDTKTSTVEPDAGRQREPEVEKEHALRNGLPCVEFSDVTFSYGDKNVFEHLNCAIRYNESVALVGGSGSGKSTLTKLAMRLYDVNDGSVKFHGRNVKDYNLSDLRKRFGIVPQEPFMFQTTILENIRIARPDASMLELIHAMEIAHVHEFVNELPKGWNTMVGEGGFGISGGQKQRIAIARAVLGNPDVLIFDEATSALDNVSEKLIQSSMEELMKDHTIIIIAHRLSTVRNVDRILVFDHGKIVEEGTYGGLAEAGGAFHKLLKIAEGEEE